MRRKLFTAPIIPPTISHIGIIGCIEHLLSFKNPITAIATGKQKNSENEKMLQT